MHNKYLKKKYSALKYLYKMILEITEWSHIEGTSKMYTYSLILYHNITVTLLYKRSCSFTFIYNDGYDISANWASNCY